MRKRILILSAILLTLPLIMIAGEDKTGPQLTFDEPMHDYGILYVDDLPDGKIEIPFSNTGDEPLVLSNVRACCGTRVTDWPKEPILPNEEGVVKVEFRIAPRPHRISRTVTVTYNNTEQPSIVHRILGEVMEREKE